MKERKILVQFELSKVLTSKSGQDEQQDDWVFSFLNVFFGHWTHSPVAKL